MGQHSTMVGILASVPSCHGFDYQCTPKISEEKLVDVARVNPRRCLEESGHMLIKLIQYQQMSNYKKDEFKSTISKRFFSSSRDKGKNEIQLPVEIFCVPGTRNDNGTNLQPQLGKRGLSVTLSPCHRFSNVRLWVQISLISHTQRTQNLK